MAHHQPEARSQTHARAERCGIDLTYTEKMSDLNETLYAESCDRRSRHEQEQARAGSITSTAARASFRCTARRTAFCNSPKYIELVGAQFKRHGTGTFRTHDWRSRIIR